MFSKVLLIKALAKTIWLIKVLTGKTDLPSHEFDYEFDICCEY